MGVTHTAQQMFQTTDYSLREGQKKAARLARQNVILVGECGSGKTEAAYFWLGDSQKRATYIMPRRVLATQTQQRLNQYDQRVYGRSRWSIQHSSAREDEQFEQAHVVTTIDQVASKYLSLGRFDAIGGSRLMQSDLIIDEVQLLEGEKTLQLLIQLLEETTALGNTFLLMTATIPDALVSFFEDRFGCAVVKITDTIQTNQTNTLEVVDDFPYADINAYTHKQIIMVNSLADQAVILEHIADPSRVIVLNSYLLPSERQARETEVYRYFGKDTPENNKILLSTQIIEAGMDISASLMTTSIAPIDSLVQRAGRLNRWGGTGVFRVVTNGFSDIYDTHLIQLTEAVLKQLQGQPFNWTAHLESVNTVMNDYYAKLVQPTVRKRYKMMMRTGGRAALIRDIDAVNVIISDTQTLADFDREAVSVPIRRLKKAQPKSLAIKTKGHVQTIALKDVRIGDTVIIDGTGFQYGTYGLRVEADEKALPFPHSLTVNNPTRYADYIEESWLTHAQAVEQAAYSRLLNDHFLRPVHMAKLPLWSTQPNPATTAELYKDVSHIIGLHDLGKLTTAWQRFIGQTNEPLAHAPFQARSAHGIKDLKHNVISMHALSGVLSSFSQNILLQHHGRLFLDRTVTTTRPCTLVADTPALLSAYGFQSTHALTAVGHQTLKGAMLMAPGKEGWGVFLYVLGVCMEADIQGIQNNRRFVLQTA